VLTEKAGLFLGVLAEKRGVAQKKITFFLAFFRFLGIYGLGMR
jgi:hypothetical protein